MLKLGAVVISMALLFVPQFSRLDSRETITYFIEDGKGVRVTRIPIANWPNSHSPPGRERVPAR
jgi:hypothetical protein